VDQLVDHDPERQGRQGDDKIAQEGAYGGVDRADSVQPCMEDDQACEQGGGQHEAKQGGGSQ
jgi:hypothetical protein